MSLATVAKLLIIASCPHRLRDGVPRPFVKTLPQKLGTGPAKMHPLLFPALLYHRRNPRVRLHFPGATIALALRAKRRQQAWRHHRARSRKRVKDEKIGMRGRRLLDLLVEIGNALEQADDDLHDHSHHHALGLDHRPIPNGRNGLANRQQAALDEFFIPTVVLAEEGPAALPAELFATPPALASAARDHIPAPCPAAQTNPVPAGNRSSSRWSSDWPARFSHPPTCAVPPPGSAPGESLPCRATSGAACRDAAATDRVADRHRGDHPCCPMDTALCAYWRTWSTAPGTDARAHTCSA